MLLALLAPFSQPTAAQQAIQVLCYLPSGSNTPQDCDNLAQAGKLQDPPWTVRIVSGAEIGRILDLSPFRMVVIGRFSADTLPANELRRLTDYANDRHCYRTMGTGPGRRWHTRGDRQWHDPQNLLVTLDPRGLGVGSYNTTLTVTSGSETFTIVVNMNLDGEQVFLPLIRR